MQIGTIKTLHLDKGFGFISVSGQPDVFFHFRALHDLEFDERLEKQRVEFETEFDAVKQKTRATIVRSVGA